MLLGTRSAPTGTLLASSYVFHSHNLFQLSMTSLQFNEALFNALSFSSILILTALGLAIIFGVMRVINMAHGEMLMLGAYTAYVLEDADAIPIFVRNLGALLGFKWST